jgi:excisionase family DNA binding protein
MKVLNVKEAAALLRISERAVLDGLRRGRLPGKKCGRAWRLSEAALAEYLRMPAVLLEENQKVGVPA